MLDELDEGIKGSGIEKSAAGLNHFVVIAGMVGSALVTEQQVDIAFFRGIEGVSIFTAVGFFILR